jgi:hypothetical protein
LARLGEDNVYNSAERIALIEKNAQNYRNIAVFIDTSGLSIKRICCMYIFFSMISLGIIYIRHRINSPF